MHAFGRLDLTDFSNVSVSERKTVSDELRAALAEHSRPPGFPTNGALSMRPGRRTAPKELSSAKSAATRKAEKLDARRAKMKADYMSAWSDAFSPGRVLLSSGFMLWMAGNSVQFFSIISVFTVLIIQIQALLGVRDTFRRVTNRNSDLKGRLGLHMLVYVVMCTVGICGAIYKCLRLGLLPVEEGDWVGLLPPEKPLIPTRGGLGF